MPSLPRGISPAVGVILVIALTLLLASTFAAGVQTFSSSLEEPGQINPTGNSDETVSGNPWSGSVGDLVRPADNEAGATDVIYRINFTIESDSDTIDNSLNSVYIEVTTGSPEPDMFSNTDQSDLDRVVIDNNSDGTTDREITSDVDGWEVQNDGAALKIGFSGSAYTASADDSVIVVFDGVDNPDTAGDYDLRAETSGDGNWHYGTITIIE